MQSANLMLDNYKVSHHAMYPDGTKLVFNNLTARGSRLEGVNKVVFFGLQYFLKEYLINRWNETFFNRPKEEVMAEYKRIIDANVGPNVINYDHIAELHSLGYLPLEIMALPEGSLVDIKVPMMVMWNTHPSFYWLPNYLETILSCTIWMPCTSATIAHEYKKILNFWAQKTSSNPDFVMWQAADFSHRGMSSLESACSSGAAHLLSFYGSDTVSSIQWLEKYYGADCTKEIISGSVCASEHAVTSAGGKENELEIYRRLMNKVYPKGILSLVLDTYDYWTALTQYIAELKPDIMKREGKIVVRPDSGVPELVICGDPSAPKDSPQYKGSIEVLWDIFGGTINEKGYKELDPHIGLIYGDSINLERCKKICSGLEAKGFASTNVVMGVGSFSYQLQSRDCLNFAVKAVYCEIGDEKRNIFKSPKGDPTKKSACGLLAVYQKRDSVKEGFMLVEEASWHQVKNCEFLTVFKNGELANQQTLSQIRARLNSFGE